MIALLLRVHQNLKVQNIERKSNTSIRQGLGKWQAKDFCEASILFHEPLTLGKPLDLFDDVFLVESEVEVIFVGIEKISYSCYNSNSSNSKKRI